MSFNSAPISNSLLTSLTKAANHLVVKIKEARSNQHLPSVIDEAMSIDPAVQSAAGIASIDIVISLITAPMAAAFEWGSGIHRKENPGLYPIEAKNAPNLVFWWEKGNKLFVGPRLPIGHPGVAAKPYIEPTMRAEKQEIKKIVGKEVKMAIITSLRQINI